MTRAEDLPAPDATAPGALAGSPAAVLDVFEQVPVILGGLTGPEHRFDAANAAYRALMGRTDALSIPAAELFPELLSQQVLTLCDEVYASGEPAAITEWRFQFGVGEAAELQEFYMDVAFAPRRSADGAIVGLTVWALDATQRVRDRQAAEQRADSAERQLRAARDVVIELQTALLPQKLPVLPGVTIAARYLVAARDQAAGGDWFDAVALPDGRVALVVGDVVGHGVVASAAMGQLRAVLNRALVETGDLRQALGWADRPARQSAVLRAATVCVVVLDPVTGVMEYSTCGHPSPLVIGEHGGADYLPGSGGGPLGTRSPLSTATARLAPGEAVLLFSDGLVERAGVAPDERRQALRKVAADAFSNLAMPLGAPVSTVERVGQQCVEMMTRGGFDDDVTVLVAQRRVVPVVSWDDEVPATVDAIGSLRTGVRTWLDELMLSPADEHAIDLGISELAANVVEHAYPGTEPGTMQLHAELSTSGALHVTIADDGAWQPPERPADLSGRGLWLAGAVVDDITITHDHGGTVVTLCKTVTHPAQLASEPASHDRLGNEHFDMRLTPGSPACLAVSGPVDISTAEALAERLDVVSRGGVHPVVLDLDGVDLLSSAGVKVLFEHRDRLAVHGNDTAIVAADDTPAQQVLDLVGLARHRVRQA